MSERWVVCASDNEEDIEALLEVARELMIKRKIFFTGVYQSKEQVSKEVLEQ